MHRKGIKGEIKYDILLSLKFTIQSVLEMLHKMNPLNYNLKARERDNLR